MIVRQHHDRCARGNVGNEAFGHGGQMGRGTVGHERDLGFPTFHQMRLDRKGCEETRERPAHMAATEDPDLRMPCDLGRDERLNLFDFTGSDPFEGQFHAAAAALPAFGAEHPVEFFWLRAGQNGLGPVDRLEFQRSAADRLEGISLGDCHEGARLSRCRALRLGHPHEHETRRTRRVGERPERGEAPVWCTAHAPAFSLSTAIRTRSGVAGASRRGQVR